MKTLIIAIVVVTMLTACGGSHTGDRVGAWVVCKKFVSAQLKSPSSAQFPEGYSSYTESLGNDKFRVVAWVDSQNSYGAMLRTNFSCEVQYQQTTDKYKLLDLTIE